MLVFLFLILILILVIILIVYIPKSCKKEQFEGTAVADKIFYINMKKQIKRKKHIVNLLTNIGFAKLKLIRPIKDAIAWKSLTKTHKHIIEKIAHYKSNKYYCIFEDDIELAEGMEPAKSKEYIKNQLNNIKDPIGFIYLGVCLDSKQAKKCTRTSCNAWCAHAYMVTPKGAKWLLNNIKDWENHITDYAYLKTLSAPVIGHEFTHDHTSPDWRGLFYQARKASWYEQGLAENGYN